MNTKPQIYFAVFVFVCFSILPYISFSQTKSEQVKERLQELFVLASYDKYDEAAAYIVYRGIDKDRKWKDVCNYSNAVEKPIIERACSDIKSLILNGGEYEFVKFQTETESEGEWCIWEVKFSAGEKKKVYFACLDINGKYCLGDID